MATVTIVVANPTDNTIKSIEGQTINCHIVGNHGSAGAFFNNIFLAKPRSDIYGFMTGNDEFYNTTCLEKIVNVFLQDISLTGLVYSDRVLVKDNKIIQQIYAPFESESKIIANPIIFVNGHIDVNIFDPSLEHLLSYDVIRKIGTSAKVVHIPEFLFKCNFVSFDITKELENYVRKSS